MNANYQDFLSLGKSLQGGEERIEEVRLGLLGFQRDVEGLRGMVEERRTEVRMLLSEKKRIRKELQLGRALLEVDERVQELEERLMVVSNPAAGKGDEPDEDFSESDEEEDSDEEEEEEGGGGGGDGLPISQLKRNAQRYMYIQRLVKRIGPAHPFLVNQEERILRLRQTVLLDLSNALKQTRPVGDPEKGRVMKILGVYREMNEFEEAVKVLKERKS